MIGVKRSSAVDRVRARHEKIGRAIKKIKTVFEAKMEEIKGCLDVIPKDLSNIVFSFLTPDDLNVSSPEELIRFAKETGSQSLDFSPYWFDTFNSDLVNLRDCHLVESVNLSDSTFICDEALKYVVKLPRLKRLNLSDCLMITETGIKYLLKSKTLKYLNISGCGLPGRATHHLKALLGLDELIY